jgi:hypothetical protein
MSDAAKAVAAPLPENGNLAETATFQANLEACRRMARSTLNQNEKRAWLDMAEAWRLLILTSYGAGSRVAPDRGESELELGDLIRHLHAYPFALSAEDR